MAQSMEEQVCKLWKGILVAFPPPFFFVAPEAVHGEAWLDGTRTSGLALS